MPSRELAYPKQPRPLGLKNEGIAVKSFFDVNPASIGQSTHGAKVVPAEEMKTKWDSSNMRGPFGHIGSRSTLREMALAAGHTDEDGYWAAR